MATQATIGKDLYEKLAALTRKVTSKIERQGGRLGAKVLSEGIKAAVPVDTGLLKSAITVRALKRKKGRTGYRVTINTQGKGARTKRAKEKRASGGFYTTSKSGKKHFYPAVLEYGAKGRPAVAPMRKGFERKKEAALDKVIESIREGVRDAAKQ